jgi:hypothetical protein
METPSKNDWLVSQSLERSLDVISAINRLSIHHKLQLAGLSDAATADETEAARNAVKEFVATLADLVKQAEQSVDQLTFGADPRLGSLARKFLADRVQGGGPMLCRPEELSELKTLLEAGDAVDHEMLVEELARLRSVLEQHSQADAAIVFNEV